MRIVQLRAETHMPLLSRDMILPLPSCTSGTQLLDPTARICGLGMLFVSGFPPRFVLGLLEDRGRRAGVGFYFYLDKRLST